MATTEKTNANQELFELLSEAESQMYYAVARDFENEELKEAYKHLKTALVTFAKVTGCCNQ